MDETLSFAKTGSGQTQGLHNKLNESGRLVCCISIERKWSPRFLHAGRRFDDISFANGSNYGAKNASLEPFVY